MNYKCIFGSGPTGILGTFLIWFTAFKIGTWLGIPKINMGTTFQWFLLGFFSVDALATIVWSLISLPPNDRGKRVITTGPFRYVRHPLYSAFIWSGTGIAAVAVQSWAVIVSIILIHFFWIWHIRKEEDFMVEKFGDEYRKYMEETNQFFPKFKRK